MVRYTMPDMIALIDQRLSEQKLARIVDTIFDGLSGKDGGAAPVAGLRGGLSRDCAPGLEVLRRSPGGCPRPLEIVAAQPAAGDVHRLADGMEGPAEISPPSCGTRRC